VEIKKGTGDVRTALFGGTGEVQVWNLMTERAEPFTAVLSCELAPGGSVGPHVQEHYPEIVVGLEGDGQATVNGAPRNLAAGDVVYLALGAVLALENRSTDTPLRYLIIKARP
jgi:quercetin dioxygenase-like cupin family protein